MKVQTARSGFPTALLTFSAMLLVLAIGFVVGRLVVARAYMGAVPKIEAQGAGGSELDEDRSAPGHIYVPNPSSSRPPEEEGRERQRSPEQPAEAAGSDVGAGASASEGVAAPEAPGAPTSTQQEARGSEPPAPVAAQPQPKGEEVAKTYSIQVGVFSDRQGARQVVDELARAGYPARISPDKRGPQELYKVVTGRYRSEYAARKALEQLRGEGFDAFLIEQ
jgi:cell division protein FtsN